MGLSVVPGVPVGIGIGLYLAKKFDKQHPEQINKGVYQVHFYHPMNHERPMEEDWQVVKRKLAARAPGRLLGGVVQDEGGTPHWIFVEEVFSYTGDPLFYRPIEVQTPEEVQKRVNELVHPPETDRLA